MDIAKLVVEVVVAVDHILKIVAVAAILVAVLVGGMAMVKRTLRALRRTPR